MPEVNQLFFQHKEIVELLIKKAGIHEGKWVLAVNIGFSAGNFGPTLDQLVPGAVLTVLGIGLNRATPETPDALKVDASLINPVGAKPRKRS